MKESIQLLNSLNHLQNDYIIVGCSSGPDSMCLLDLLIKSNYKIVCAHVNHNLRKESKEEYEFLKEYCLKNNITFEGLELKKEENGNEFYYRKKRYAFYKNLADKYNTKYIATAHHGDDLIETILMRITRGSNLKGYEGFNKVFNEKGYIFIKPLIFYTKEEILKYNENNKIPYYNDRTNELDDYTRNRYRHNVLPFLKKENKEVHKKYLQFSEELSKAQKHIQKEVDDAILKNYSNYSINLDEFNKLDSYIQECELQTIFSKIYGDDIDRINKKHIETILSLIRKNKNFKLDLPQIKIEREYNKLNLKTIEENESFKVLFNNYIGLNNGYIIKEAKESGDKSNYTLHIYSKEIKMPLYVRNRIDGDKIEIKNLKGRKKIKDIFIDEKIAPSLRNSWPILVDSNDTILWLPGLKKSKFDNLQKYDIILRYERKEQENEK